MHFFKGYFRSLIVKPQLDLITFENQMTQFRVFWPHQGRTCTKHAALYQQHNHYMGRVPVIALSCENALPIGNEKNMRTWLVNDQTLCE